MSHHHDKHHHHHHDKSKHNISGSKFSFFSQKDHKWANDKIGNSSSTIGEYGCFLTCLSMMVGKDPSTVNHILTGANAYKGDLIDPGKAANALGLAFRGTSKDEPNWSPVIQEVDYSSKPGIQSHFVLKVIENGSTFIVDPLDSSEKKKSIGSYKFVSYRLFQH